VARLAEGSIIHSQPEDARGNLGTTRRLSHERCEAVLDALGHGVCLLTPEGRIEQANRAMAAMWGKPAQEMVGRAPHEVLPGLAPPSAACPFYRLRKSLRRESAEWQWAGRWYQVTADPIFDRKGKLTGAVVTMVDNTERKLLEEQLRHSHKMEAIGRLAGVLAHDFSNLLTMISGYGQMLLDGLPARDPGRKDVEAMLEAAGRATHLTRQLLTIGRRQPVRPRSLDLNRLVSRLERILRRVAGRRIQLSVALKRPLGRIKADPTQIEQVIMNLVVNARDAMPKGGRLTIETSQTQVKKDGAPGRPDLPPGRYIRLTVRDTGSGMDADTRSHLFEPFFTTKAASKGVGLGLPIVYGIVRQSGGGIEVDSEPGQGAAFRVSFPMWPAGASRRRGPAQ
jgi:PAS domain S-box-containing protein